MVVIINKLMSDEMEKDAVDCAVQALEKYNNERDIAAFIKKEFDKKHNTTWHCIVGKSFGSSFTHGALHLLLRESYRHPSLQGLNVLCNFPKF